METYAEIAERTQPWAPSVPTDQVFVARVRSELRDARDRAIATVPAGLRRRVFVPLPTRIRKRWTRASIIAAIVRYSNENGHTPPSSQWVTAGEWWPSRATVLVQFGSWAEAIVAAGYPRPTPGLTNWVESRS